jgi:hypothetical protein
MEEILIRFEKSLENVICITGDNCATNAKIARLVKVPLVGMSVSDYLHELTIRLLESQV